MKKLFSLLVAMLLMPFAFAQESLPDPGTTPDSQLYGVELAFEKIGLLLTFDKAAKAEKRLQHANERLAEVQAMIAQNKLDAAAKAEAERTKEIVDLQGEAQGLPQDVRAHLLEQLERHVTELNEVLAKAPESAKQGLTNAITKSSAVISRFKEESQSTAKPAEAGKPTEGGEQAAEAKPAESRPAIPTDDRSSSKGGGRER